MDFHSLSRRELQALCKRNKIPANMTNVAMADALKSLEIVEGFEEIMNHFLSNPAPSPVSTARTATRTARRKTMGEETQISQTASRSSRVARKSLDQEMDQENKNVNVGEAKTEAKLVTNDPKTPAAQSTRRRGPAASIKNKASAIHGSVQQVYSTRRSVRLLEKTMADLTLTGKTPVEPVKIDESLTEAKEEVEDPTGAKESEIIPGGNLSSALEKEWDMRDKHPEDDKSKTVAFNSEKSVIVEDVSGVDAKPEAEEEKMDKFGTCLSEEMEDASDENGSDEIPVPEISSEFAKEEALIEPANNPQKMSVTFEEETNDDKLDKTAIELDTKEESESELESESEQSAVYSDQEVESGENASTESDQSDIETDSGMVSDQSVAGSDVDLSDANLLGIMEPGKLISDQLEEQDEVQSAAESNEFDDDFSETETDIKSTFTKEQTETETLDDTSKLSEPEDQAPISDRTQDSPLVMAASGCKGITPLSPFTAESISSQFPRPNLSSTPGKSSSKKPKSVQKLTVIADDTNKENFNNGVIGIGIKTEPAAKKDEMKKKNNAVEEEDLKGVSLRKLTKMVKELQIKNRPALQKLPGNQIVEQN